MSLDPETLGMIGARMARDTPQSAALGIRFVSAQKGMAVLEVPYSAKLVGDPGTGVLAGGVVTTLLDHVCGLAIVTAEGFPASAGGTATLDLRIDYMRPAEPGRSVFGRAHCYKLTRSIGFVRASAYESDPDDPIATAQAAFALMDPPSPQRP
jgi:uncharacterized protein (TIGR00369 family)